MAYRSSIGPVGPERPLHSENFSHDYRTGCIRCERCGRRAFSRNVRAIADWKRAHEQVCPGYFLDSEVASFDSER